MAIETLVTESRHPFYTLEDYVKFRLTYAGGRQFIETYLEKYDTRENAKDFLRRKKLTHNPGFAAQALDEIIAGIAQRSPEIVRSGGTPSYARGIQGYDGGVDLQNSSMDRFITSNVLPELLSMGRCGVYVDMPEFNPESTIAEYAVQPHPYLYYYRACDILNWHQQFDPRSSEILTTTVLLRETNWQTDDYGLPKQPTDLFRLVQKVPDGVVVTFLEQYQDVQDGGKKKERILKQYKLKLKRIPFVMYDIGKSLLTDAADYQIGLLNLASADLSYAINSNFPFYVEGYDPKTEALFNKQGPQTGFDAEGQPLEKTSASGDTAPEIVVGTMHGRRYPLDAPPPAFIHPSPEPLTISMLKQKEMKEDIRRLLNLAITTVQPSRKSGVASQQDQQNGLESGLAAIGIELEGAEREIAVIWADYEGQDITKKVSIAYPDSYSVKTDDDRMDEAKKLQEVQGAAPSNTFQKEIAKRIVKALLDGKVNSTVIDKIRKEIDAAKYITGDFEAIKSDYEIGIVDGKTAAEARGYDPELFEVAQKERVKRMADTAIAQSVGGGSGAAGQAAARGGEGGGDPKGEKTVSQNADNNPDGGKKVRGKADGGA
jgi:hypothetical protein